MEQIYSGVWKFFSVLIKKIFVWRKLNICVVDHYKFALKNQDNCFTNEIQFEGNQWIFEQYLTAIFKIVCAVSRTEKF